MVRRGGALADHEWAEYRVEGGDDLYREIRIENVVTDENGEKARLSEGLPF
jgi:hypothetical protein